jgi:hypothetical protein
MSALFLRGNAGHGGTWLGKAWQGTTFVARRSAMHCMAWLGTAGLGSAWQGTAWQGTTFEVGQAGAWPTPAWHGLAGRGAAGQGIPWQGAVSSHERRFA